MDEALRAILEEASRAAERGDRAQAWAVLLPHRARLSTERPLAELWLLLWRLDPQPPAEAAPPAELAEVALADPGLMASYLQSLLKEVDGRPGDELVGPDDPARAAVELGRRALAGLSGAPPAARGRLCAALATALRLAGPEHDAEALAALERAEREDPAAPQDFDRGLFYKNRGRFAEALACFERARTRAADEPTLWNLALCGTAAGRGAVALEAWRALGFEVELGGDGLPRMKNLGRAKLRLSSATPWEPGVQEIVYEHVWVQPESPCHGVVLNPTERPLRADYGDTVVWDGAPIGYARVGERTVPRFPLLAKLRSGGARKLAFRAQQPAAGTVDALGRLLPDAFWLYVFDEALRHVCPECIRTGGPHGSTHGEGTATSMVVRGVLVVEPEGSLAEARRALEPLLAATPGLSFAVPELYAALGEGALAARQQVLADRLEALSGAV